MSKIFLHENYQEFLGIYTDQIDAKLDALSGSVLVERVWKKDHTVWSKNPEEIVNRLGWLDLPENISSFFNEILEFKQQIIDEGITHIVLLGMGGSSLAPEFFSETFNNKNSLKLKIVDSTHPGSIRNTKDSINSSTTLFIVSTKSGSTVETISLLKYFYRELTKELGENFVGKHFAAITDPGSELQKLAQDLKFRKLFLNDPNIGGRFSVLSLFGLVAAAFSGVDLEKLIKSSLKISEVSKQNSCINNTPARLGIALGELCKAGVDTVFVITSPEITHFKYWLEQLVAESTGKNGNGLLPVIKDSFTKDFENKNCSYLFVGLENDKDIEKQFALAVSDGNPSFYIKLDDIYEVGGEFFRWEIAVSILGHILNINPFDQPDVELAKKITKEFIDLYKSKGEFRIPKANISFEDIDFYSKNGFENIENINSWFFKLVKNKGYIAILAFIEHTKENESFLNGLSNYFMNKYQIPATFGFGPRYLHSTGQLHKGDSGKGIFIHITSDIETDIDIPDNANNDFSSLSFKTLFRAQALGDYNALVNKDRDILQIHCRDSFKNSCNKLKDIF